nr:MAG TPA: hypothetical protein [Caudoviricetes sp.]
MSDVKSKKVGDKMTILQKALIPEKNTKNIEMSLTNK